MESIEAPLRKLKINMAIHTVVAEVFNEKRKKWVSGVGDKAVFSEEDLGWFVSFEGSFEALHMGPDRPDYKPGDRVKITFEKVD